MSHIRVLICRVDDPASDQMTELAAFDLPPTDISMLQSETALDKLEMILPLSMVDNSVQRFLTT